MEPIAVDMTGLGDTHRQFKRHEPTKRPVDEHIPDEITLEEADGTLHHICRADRPDEGVEADGHHWWRDPDIDPMTDEWLWTCACGEEAWELAADLGPCCAEGD